MMTSATPQDYAWWEEFRDGIGVSGFCFTLVAGMEPAAVLHRLAATSGELMEAPGYIEVGPADGGSVIVDLAGYAGIMRDVVCELSRGTVLATVHNNIDSIAKFIYAADGKVITELDPMFPDEPRRGAEPDRLLEDLEDLGLVDEFEEDDEEWDEEWLESSKRFVETALALAERCTGIRLTSEHVRGPLPYAVSVAHLYDDDPSV
ncbi:DUF6461 domain-containing protein [Streptosporangium canum]|uniref:DUF6461 domain-containing protein n=1 Tax=Streptosporangium canum TaxID=324952 RepID=UPI00379ED667